MQNSPLWPMRLFREIWSVQWQYTTGAIGAGRERCGVCAAGCAQCRQRCSFNCWWSLLQQRSGETRSIRHTVLHETLKSGKFGRENSCSLVHVLFSELLLGGENLRRQEDFPRVCGQLHKDCELFQGHLQPGCVTGAVLCVSCWNIDY